MDGADINYEDSKAFKNGTAPDWLITFQKTLRSQLGPKYIITHAPEAPYFQDKQYPNGAYCKIHNSVGNTIDFYNVQFYNQG